MHSWTRNLYQSTKAQWAKGFSNARTSAEASDWAFRFSEVISRLLSEHLHWVAKCSSKRNAKTTLCLFLCALDKETLDMLGLAMAQVQMEEPKQKEHAIH